MNSSKKTQHELLLDAGWIYHDNSDMYSAPGDRTDGSERRFDRRAAWQRYQTNNAASAIVDQATRKAQPGSAQSGDPRQKEPE